MIGGAYNPGDNASRKAFISSMVSGTRFQPMQNAVGTTSYGPSTAEAVTNTIFGVLMTGVSLYANQQVANQQAVNAEQAALGKALSNVTSGMNTFMSAKSDYEAANKTLKDLEARKENAGKTDALQEEISKFESNFENAEVSGQSRADLQKQYNDIGAQITALSEDKESLGKLTQNITNLESVAQKDCSGTIGTSGLSVNYTGNSATDCTLAANTIKAAHDNPMYYTVDKDTGKKIFLQEMYDDDMNAANAMDKENLKVIKAKNDLANAKSDLAKIGAKYGLGENVTQEALEAKIQELQNQQDGIGAQMMTGADNSSMSISDYNKKLSELNKNLEQAKSDKDDKTLDDQIKTAKANVEKKKNNYESARSKLEATKKTLENYRTQMLALTSTEEIDRKKHTYDSAKAENNKDRTIFNKMFGTGKNQKVISTKDSYTKAKNQQRVNNQAFTAANGFSANAMHIAQINGQLDMINEVLGQSV